MRQFLQKSEEVPETLNAPSDIDRKAQYMVAAWAVPKKDKKTKE